MRKTFAQLVYQLRSIDVVKVCSVCCLQHDSLYVVAGCVTGFVEVVNRCCLRLTPRSGFFVVVVLVLYTFFCAVWLTLLLLRVL